ncbi:MAG: TonB-dependent receptor [Candidatus Poribacteria bacterium]|nr:TonB-dependent receptor [Candidatus Poribacteria bacterium]
MKGLSLVSIVVFTLFVVLGITTVSVHAASLNITVTDSGTGNKLNNVTITVKPKSGDATHHIERSKGQLGHVMRHSKPKSDDAADPGVTDVDGTLTLANLSADVYTITVRSPGYPEEVVTNVELAADQTKSVEIALTSEVIELEKVSVTASRRKEKVLEAPASVALLDDSEIKDRVSLSVTEHLKSLRAVDVVTSGIGTSYVVVRGFNNVFSGNLLSLVDNRIASVPSLRVNAYTLIPTISEDIEQIEVVSGPGAALYGPNSANGVMHILTRSPFTSQGTTVSVGGGERRILTGSLRHAGVINDTIGYKLTANYTRGDDWEEGRAKEDMEGKLEPLFDTAHTRGEFRVDYSPSDDATVILASGLTQASGIELTGIGAGQAKNWIYGYAQARFIYKDLFAQAFLNRSDAGETYVLRSGQHTIDNSNLYVGQIQHSYGIGNVQRFTYGLDVLLTRPDTEGTINGVNEDEDSINEIGAYVQSETNILPQLKLLAAGRVDQHNHLNDIVLSPRVALAFQPTDDHNLRVTYNRAFNTPGTSNLFLDILSSPDAFKLGANFEPALGFSPNIDVRAQGVPSENGFTFKRSENGLPLFRSPFSPLGNLEDGAYIPLNDPLFTNVMWNVARSAVMSGAKPLFEAGLAAQGLPNEMVAALSAGFDSVIPQQVADVKNVLRSLDPETSSFVDVEDVNDVASLKPTITQTYEVGYKGILLNRLAFSADVYHSRINNFIAPLFVETPNVFLDAATLSASLAQQIGAALADPQNAQLAQALLAFDAPTQGGNDDGSPVEELVTLFVAGTENNGAAYIPFGTVTPEQAADPNAVMLTYRNYGDISLNGLDMNFTFFLNPSWSLGANYSFVSKDLFENVDGIGDIALNAPKNKFGVNVQYTNIDLGLGAGLRARFVEGFPVRSGVYVGEVESYWTLDLNAGYAIPLGPKPRLSVTVQNLLDRKHQQFVGTPEIGRLAMARLTQTF